MSDTSLMDALASLMQERTAVDQSATVVAPAASDVAGLAGQCLATVASADSTPVNHKGKQWHKVPTESGITGMQQGAKGPVKAGDDVILTIGGWPFTR